MNNIENFKAEIHSLLDQSNYIRAKERLKEKNAEFSKNDENYDEYLTTIAGLFLDLGTEGHDLEATELGLQLLKDNETSIKLFQTEQSYNYCIANGLDSLFRIQNNGKGLPTLESIRPNLIEAKNYYFKAFKAINFKEVDEIDLQILINLGNNLSQSGRCIESIRLYTSVLRFNSNFPQALIGLAEGIDHWRKSSFSPISISLYLKVFSLFDLGLKQGVLPLNQTAYFSKQAKNYYDILVENKFDFDTVEKELKRNDEEYKTHSSFRKFCIDNFLSLNEHAIYCNCYSADTDDLSIVHSQISLFGDKVGKMELLLNRLKSEFHLARKLYYEGISDSENFSEVLFSELMDGEMISEAVEKVRTSFRMCFGMLDKIAHGICYFFELPKKKGELIYFEKFWEANPDRWNTLKDLRNPHIVALYSIANDLKGKDGEFRFYKQWRNKLEHNNLILVDKVEKEDLLELFNDELFITKVDFADFKEQGIHLLQIVCAAIFSYVYLIRTESMKNGAELSTVPFVIQPKRNY